VEGTLKKCGLYQAAGHRPVLSILGAGCQIDPGEDPLLTLLKFYAILQL
jgi:hypothetical protein